MLDSSHGYADLKQDEPPVIDGTYRVLGETVKARPEPIFNHWHNAVPLLLPLGLQLLIALGYWAPRLGHSIAGSAVAFSAIGLFLLTLVGPRLRSRMRTGLRVGGRSASLRKDPPAVA